MKKFNTEMLKQEARRLEDDVKIGAIITYDIPYVSNDHAVVICTIFDKCGKKVQAIGESINSKLPATKASEIALCKAVSKYLGIEDVNTDNDDNNPNESPDCNESTIADDEIYEVTDEDIELSEEDLELSNDKSMSVVANEDVEAPVRGKVESVGGEGEIESPLEKLEERLNELGSKIIDFGKYKGQNKTVAEVYDAEEGGTWLDFALSRTKAESAKYLEEYTKIRRG